MPALPKIIPAVTFIAVAGMLFSSARRRRNVRTNDLAKGSRQTVDARGRTAVVPETIPARGLYDVFWRVLAEVKADRVTLIAAGVTFHLLLALFPTIAAVVSLYGLIADPSTMGHHLRELSGMLPPGAFDIVAEQIVILSTRQDSTLGLALVISLCIAFWSSHSGTLAVFDAMNVAYEETEKRSFIQLNLVALCFTMIAIIAVVLAIGFVAVMPLVFAYLALDGYMEISAMLLRWPLLLSITTLTVIALYRFGPSREPAKVRWLTWGAALTTVGWLAMSLGFSFYMENFANYTKTYGALGALIGFLIWMWLSVTILIIGGELNAELEHQTAMDTTTGRPRPIGSRGAYVADTIGESRTTS